MDLFEERNVFNTTSLICSLTFELFQTDEVFTMNERKHTHTHTASKPMKLAPFFFTKHLLKEGKVF